jgi:thioredoxin reductase (NADPH)
VKRLAGGVADATAERRRVGVPGPRAGGFTQTLADPPRHLAARCGLVPSRMRDRPPSFELIVVGAGPIGLEAAIRAKRAGLSCAVLDKGPVASAIVRFPTYMTFFTTSERLEIGGHPFVTASDKPTRKEALDYYRKVVQNEALEVRTFTEVTALEPLAGGGFAVRTRDERAVEGELHAGSLMLATGYFDTPKRLAVPGEDLPHVSHYFDEPHVHFGRDVVIVGAGSSAADTALELQRAGARVAIVHRGADFRRSLKYWIRPNLENRVAEGSIAVHFHSVVREITPSEVRIEERRPGRPTRTVALPADRVFLLTGYVASPTLLQACGVRTDPVTLAADLDPATFETSVSGLYCIGSAGFGSRTSDVFIENGLLHARQAVAHLQARIEARRRNATTGARGP